MGMILVTCFEVPLKGTLSSLLEKCTYLSHLYTQGGAQKSQFRDQEAYALPTRLPGIPETLSSIM